MHTAFRLLRQAIRRGDRGASGVEYALVVSLLVVGSTASFEMMDTRVEQHYDETADDIGQADLGHFTVTTTTCVGCPVSTTSFRPAPSTIPPIPTTSSTLPTTTSTSTTTTTPSTTSTSTSTTTTAKPTATTTTTTTTTTTKPKPSATTSYDDLSTSSKKNATAKVRIDIDDEAGSGLRGATVEVTMTTKRGETKSFTYVVGKSGEKTLSWSGLDHDEFPITVTIDSIELDGTSYEPKVPVIVLHI